SLVADASEGGVSVCHAAPIRVHCVSPERGRVPLFVPRKGARAMSLRHWAFAPLSHLFRTIWEAGEFFFNSPAFKPRPKKAEPTRLEGPTPLEFRGPPDDWMGLITGGLGLGQIAWLVPQPALHMGGHHQPSQPHGENGSPSANEAQHHGSALG